MKATIIIIGSIVFSIITISIPMLFACSIVQHWDGFLRLILATLTATEGACVGVLIGSEAWGNGE